MVENNSPFSPMPQDDALQLDSTKRCLFPVEDGSPSSLRFVRSRSGQIESLREKRDERDKNEPHNLPEETRNSPISVVCVLSTEDSTLHSKLRRNSGALAASSSSHRREKLSCDGVEEQTVIEVQYVEAGHQDHSEESVADLYRDNGKNSPERKYAPSHLGDVRAKPLLDIEKTPSRSQTKEDTAPTHLFGCGGRGACFSVCDDHQLVERTITDFLEDGSVSTPNEFKTTCHDWQAWSYFGFGTNEKSSGHVEQSPSKENIRSILRRRTSHSLRVRKANVRQLKQNLAPFAHSPARSPARAPGLFRNRSFSVADHRSAIVRVSKDRKRSMGSCTDMLQLCTMYESIGLDSPELVRKQTSNNVNDDDLSYDSDPEDFTRRRSDLRAQVPTVAVVDTGSSDFAQSFSSPSRSLLDVHNDELFSNIVQEIFNKTTTLVLHPLLDSNKPGSSQPVRPIAVDAWLERGQHLAYALIQPKWIWKAKPRLDATGQSSVRQDFCLQGIELLDITRILKMEELETCNMPFAKPSHCFFVKSIHNEEFCFEAKSKHERNRVVSSLKLLIARFGAKVLTGDPQVYYEFFWTSDGVPGQAPDLHEVFVETR